MKTLEAGPSSTEICPIQIIMQTSDETQNKSDTHKGCKNRRNDVTRKSSVTGALPGEMGDAVPAWRWKMERSRKNKMKRGTNEREEGVRSEPH